MSSHQISNTASYPPGFRPTHQPSPVTEPSDQAIDQPDPLPIIDVADLDEFKLHVACSEWGIFRLVNHGIPGGLIARLQAEAKALLDLSFESKRALLKDPDPVYSWGSPALNPAGVKTPQGSPEVGLETITIKLASRVVSCHGAARETAVGSFRMILEEYGEQVTTIAQKLFQVIAKNLKLNQELVDKYLDETTGILRVNRYPPGSSSDGARQANVKGLDAHTDSSVLTILLLDSVRGLELSRGGTWISVKPIPNTLIVHVGDMLQAMSDDEYKSVEHRVTLNSRRQRISVGYFVFPEYDTVVTGSSGKYKPFTCKEFRAQVAEDVAKLGWKVGLSRYRS